MKKILLFCSCALFVSCLPFISPVVPDTADADIFMYKDDSGTLHYTDKPEKIPPKFRATQKKFLSSPSKNQQPSLTVLGAPPPSPSQFVPEPNPVSQPIPDPQENISGQAEQLQARIEAKEKFIESIDLKRSLAVNPLGNKFVSPEDLDLYNKYTEELSQDRQKLQELQSNPR
jgi:hypothetical protein